MDGDWAAVGYFSDGRFDIYRCVGGGWAFVLTREVPTLPDIIVRGMARDLDLKDDLMVVSATSSNVKAVGNAGVMLVFRRDLGGAGNRGLQATLIAPSPSSDNDFGGAVFIFQDDNFLACGVFNAIFRDPSRTEATHPPSSVQAAFERAGIG